MTSPIRGASSSSYNYSHESNPESSPPQQGQTSNPPPSAQFSGLQHMSSRHRRRGELLNVRFSTEEPTVHDLPREDRKPGIVLSDDTALSYRAGQLYATYPRGLPSDVKRSTKRDPKLYAAYKDLLKNNGYKG
ncbi:hypothetical protein EIQ06_14560 [Xanthomonas campestris pv. campestris]|uniref:Uncharacterized protein n=1 Tax=Xanthomonas campestris pv. campestris (strain B100) TaxID=509169 RepID=B0RMV6_XANCB|nr:hypothetical protein DFG55_05270 [Xanthomonas campestris pv. campestris]QCX69726.1 hypothetical protein DFG54_02100 [Xanthomonas campestris pv. campestris]CAP49791.1 hypothetical protein XCCB100_0460 [Xanthomonas campestris pv. campestris]